MSASTEPVAMGGGRSSNFHANLVLTVILTVQLMVVLDGTVVIIALPHIRTALHFSTASLSYVVTAYMLTFGGLLLLGARAGDILGRKTTLTYGIAIFTVASLLGGFAENSGELLAGRALQGVGGALASPASLALLMSKFKEGRERTRAIGLYTAVSVGGSAVGLIIGGVLVQQATWRWVMFINVPIGIAVVILGQLFIDDSDQERVRGPFDLLGALTSTGGMAALVYGFVRAASDGWSDLPAIVAFFVGLALLGLFVVIEKRATAPITPLRLFNDRNRVAAYLCRLTVVAGTNGMFFFLSQFLQSHQHYSPISNGAAFLPITIALFAASQLTSRGLVDRFGAKPLMIFGIALTMVGIVWLTQLSLTSHYSSMVLGPLVLIGTGNGLAFVPMTSAALHGVANQDAGAGSGLVNAMQQVGGALGLAILVSVYGAVDRHALHHPPANLHGAALSNHAYVVGVDWVFAGATVFMIITLFMFGFMIKGLTLGHHDQDEELVETLEVAGSISATASN
jgi:EmrB/QacA subfamily drug resistance transporter